VKAPYCLRGGCIAVPAGRTSDLAIRQDFNDRMGESDRSHDAGAGSVSADRLCSPGVLRICRHRFEIRSAGKNMLIRMGPANSRAHQATLREFRAEISQEN